MSSRRPLTIRLGSAQLAQLRSSLLPEDDRREHAAFLFGIVSEEKHLDTLDIEVLTSANLTAQSCGYLELRDGLLQEMIARAHRMNAALIEVHSHPFSRGPDVEFSMFDREGLTEVAPHVVWRLPGRPYAALVLGQDSFDGLHWIERTSEPSGAVVLEIDGTRLKPSGESLRRWRARYGQV